MQNRKCSRDFLKVWIWRRAKSSNQVPKPISQVATPTSEPELRQTTEIAKPKQVRISLQKRQESNRSKHGAFDVLQEVKPKRIGWRLDQCHRQQSQFNEIATSACPKELALPVEEEQFDNAARTLRLKLATIPAWFRKQKLFDTLYLRGKRQCRLRWARFSRQSQTKASVQRQVTSTTKPEFSRVNGFEDSEDEENWSNSIVDKNTSGKEFACYDNATKAEHCKRPKIG